MKKYSSLVQYSQENARSQRKHHSPVPRRQQQLRPARPDQAKLAVIKKEDYHNEKALVRSLMKEDQRQIEEKNEKML